MNNPLWILPALVLALLLANIPVALANLTDDQSTVTHYVCVDENGDEACDDPPED